MPFTSAAGKSGSEMLVSPPAGASHHRKWESQARKDNTRRPFPCVKVPPCRNVANGLGSEWRGAVLTEQFPVEGEPEAQGKRTFSTTMHSQLCAMASASLATSSLASAASTSASRNDYGQLLLYAEIDSIFLRCSRALRGELADGIS